MLTTHQQDDRLRHADNLLPTDEGGMASRPGAIQIADAPIRAAVPWGNRLLMESGGRIQLWRGDMTDLGINSVIDLAPAGRLLQGAVYQALTSNAEREDRLYIADGVNPLWFTAFRNGGYVTDGIANTIKDSGGVPYPVPIATAVTSWRERLWVADGTNRVQHCQGKKPDEWDPLWTVEAQGDTPDIIHALRPHGELLVLGLRNSLWGVTGTSQYNWDRDQIASTGCLGPNALAGTSTMLYHLAQSGIYAIGASGPLSDDLREWFHNIGGVGDLVVDGTRGLLLCSVHGRLFVMNLKTGLFGEISDVSAYGLIQLQDYIGWYGADGAWVLGARDTDDKRLDGTLTPPVFLYDPWEAYPNLNGNGRALCNRVLLLMKGSPRGHANYTLWVDGAAMFADSFSLTDDANVDTWSSDISGLGGEPWPTAPVRRELVPQQAGGGFRHTLSASVYMEVLDFRPNYVFGEKDQ